jgi:sporulation protein YlmC with PRC-barrel domain
MTATSDRAVLRLLSDTGQTVSSDADDIRGRIVKDVGGAEIGKIEDLLVDQAEGRVRMLLVEHGGFLGIGRAKSFVPVDDVVRITERTVHINHSQNHVDSGPGYDPDLMNDTKYLGSVYGHYGMAPYWGAGYEYPGYPYFPALRSARDEKRSW